MVTIRHVLRFLFPSLVVPFERKNGVPMSQEVREHLDSAFASLKPPPFVETVSRRWPCGEAARLRKRVHAVEEQLTELGRNTEKLDATRHECAQLRSDFDQTQQHLFGLSDAVKQLEIKLHKLEQTGYAVQNSLQEAIARTLQAGEDERNVLLTRFRDNLTARITFVQEELLEKLSKINSCQCGQTPATGSAQQEQAPPSAAQGEASDASAFQRRTPPPVPPLPFRSGAPSTQPASEYPDQPATQRLQPSGTQALGCTAQRPSKPSSRSGWRTPRGHTRTTTSRGHELPERLGVPLQPTLSPMEASPLSQTVGSPPDLINRLQTMAEGIDPALTPPRESSFRWRSPHHLKSASTPPPTAHQSTRTSVGDSFLRSFPSATPTTGPSRASTSTFLRQSGSASSTTSAFTEPQTTPEVTRATTQPPSQSSRRRLPADSASSSSHRIGTRQSMEYQDCDTGRVTPTEGYSPVDIPRNDTPPDPDAPALDSPPLKLIADPEASTGGPRAQRRGSEWRSEFASDLNDGEDRKWLKEVAKMTDDKPADWFKMSPVREEDEEMVAEDVNEDESGEEQEEEQEEIRGGEVTLADNSDK